MKQNLLIQLQIVLLYLKSNFVNNLILKIDHIVENKYILYTDISQKQCKLHSLLVHYITLRSDTYKTQKYKCMVDVFALSIFFAAIRQQVDKIFGNIILPTEWSKYGTVCLIM